MGLIQQLSGYGFDGARLQLDSPGDIAEKRQAVMIGQPRSMSLYPLLSFQPLLHALPIPVQSCSNNLRMLLLSTNNALVGEQRFCFCLT